MAERFDAIVIGAGEAGAVVGPPPGAAGPPGGHVKPGP